MSESKRLDYLILLNQSRLRVFHCHIKSAFLYYHQQSKTDANMDLYPYK